MRKRTQTREAQRGAVKDARQRLKLALLLEGGTPENPIRVSSASVVEVHVESLACVVCGHKVRVQEHKAIHLQGEVVRDVAVKCTQCGVVRSVYLVATPPLN